jgi:hypothetical protein
VPLILYCNLFYRRFTETVESFLGPEAITRAQSKISTVSVKRQCKDLGGGEQETKILYKETLSFLHVVNQGYIEDLSVSSLSWILLLLVPGSTFQ